MKIGDTVKYNGKSAEILEARMQRDGEQTYTVYKIRQDNRQYWARESELNKANAKKENNVKAEGTE